jgi:hypothetical protein
MTVLYDSPLSGFRVVLIGPRQYLADLYRLYDSKVFDSATGAFLWAIARTP